MPLKRWHSAPAGSRHGRPRHVRARPHALAAPPTRHHIRAGGRRTSLLARLALSSKSLAKAHCRLAARRIYEWTFYDVDRRRVPASHARSSVTHDSHDEASSADDGCCSLDLSGGTHFSFDVRFTEALHYGRSSCEELSSAMARTPSCAFCVVLAGGYGCGDRLASSRALSAGHAVLLGKGHRGSVLLVRWDIVLVADRATPAKYKERSSMVQGSIPFPRHITLRRSFWVLGVLQSPRLLRLPVCDSVVQSASSSRPRVRGGAYVGLDHVCVLDPFSCHHNADTHTTT